MMFVAEMILAIRWYFLCTVYPRYSHRPFWGDEQCVFLTEKHFGVSDDAPKITE